MTTTQKPAWSETDEGIPSDAPSGRRAPRESGRVGVPLLLCAVVALCAQIPVLFNRSFYFTDDSAAQFLPMWHHLGRRLLSGEWPLLLDLDTWMGGNLAGEAMFGTWNPVNLACFVLVVWIGDLAVAATAVKSLFLVVLALGTYLLAREYGARKGAAFVLAAAMPFSGFVLYFQAVTWAAGLIALSWVPHVWWSARSAASGRCPVVVPFVFGALCVTSGNPYGLLALFVVFAGLLVELLVRRSNSWRPVVLLVVTGVCVVSVAPLVFLPVLGASEVGWRSSGLFNTAQLAPSLNDLLNVGVASHLPDVRAFGPAKLAVPGVYLAWFVLVVVPWMDWRVLTRRWRELTGVLLVGAVYAALAIGPSHVWLWRWPLRMVPVLFLAAAVLWAVVLSAGLRTDHMRVRAGATAGVLALGGYLSFAARPSMSSEHLVCLGLTAVLITLAVWARRWGWFLVLMQVGTVAMLLLQLVWMPVNDNVRHYNFPTSVRQVRADFAAYDGTVAQIADVTELEAGSVDSRRAWRNVLFGNMYAAAGVPSLTAYTGLGNTAFHETLCLNYFGASCPDAYATLWKPAWPGGPVLADLLRVRTVAVQRSLVEAPTVPAGWDVVRSNEMVTVLRRQAPPEHPRGRLSWASDGVEVVSDVERGARHERVRYRSSGDPAQLVFARLAWPGYSATVDGRSVSVEATRSGLVRVELPSGVENGVVALTWRPPGYSVGVLCIVLGAVLALVGTIAHFRRSGRSRR